MGITESTTERLTYEVKQRIPDLPIDYVPVRFHKLPRQIQYEIDRYIGQEYFAKYMINLGLEENNKLQFITFKSRSNHTDLYHNGWTFIKFHEIITGFTGQLIYK